MHSLRSFLFILYFNADQMLAIDFQSFKTRILTKLTIILHATRIIIIPDMTYQQFWGEFRSWKIFELKLGGKYFIVFNIVLFYFNHKSFYSPKKWKK